MKFPRASAKKGLASGGGQAKFRNTKVVVDGITFDSKGEMNRWFDLRAMEKAGEISDLHRQVPFEIAPSVIIEGRKKPAMKFTADFAYMQGGKLIVEDFKSKITAEERPFRMRLHLMKSVWDIDVKIVMKN